MLTSICLFCVSIEVHDEVKTSPIDKEKGRSREGGKEEAFAEQGVCDLRSAVCVAQEVGARLGIGEILQRSV